MKTPEQVKGSIRNIAKDKGIRPQAVLQMYLLERLLIRIATSPYRRNFILKGGLLISSMLGLGNRTTLDMDATVDGLHMDEANIQRIIGEIIQPDRDDDIVFRMIGIERIREQDKYHNFRVSLMAVHGQINAPLKMDITTGDEIVPEALIYSFPLMFSGDTIAVPAYPLETILAEKYETIIRRNIVNTRARDFYDLHMLLGPFFADVRSDILKKAVYQTAAKRGSMSDITDSMAIIQELRNELSLQSLWDVYARKNPYVRNITFQQTLDSVELLAKLVG